MKLLMKSLTLLGFAVVIAVTVNASEKTGPNDFTLKPIIGEKAFKLSENKGKYVAIHFLLKTECPICIRHTREYFENEKKHPDVIQLFVKPDTPSEIKAWASKIPLGEKDKTPEIYHDPSANLAKKFSVPGGYKFHGQVVHYPALIILGPDGNEVFRYVGKSNSDRFIFKQFVEKMKELKS